METQNTEYKEAWRDEYLKWICGFANAQGGRLFVGVDDKGQAVGVENAKKLMEDIPNKIMTNLGIVCDVNLQTNSEGREYIEIVVEPSSMPIAYHGAYHYRSGATKQELKGVSLQQFILGKLGRSWDDVANPNLTLDVIDPKAISYFVNSSIRAGRLSPSAKSDDIKTTLENLHLLDENGHLKNAALLLFSQCPQKYFPGVQFKIGRFGKSSADLMFDDVVEGNILQMVDRVIELLRSKYLISPISYDGLQRIETLEVPVKALREMLYNAVVHKEYPGVPVQMWVFNEHIELWNQGNLPKDYTVETLLAKHSSVPRNQNIANVFYKAGFIETWGRGIEKICDEFEKAAMETPKFEQTQGGLLVTFKRKQFDEKAMNDPKESNVTKDVTKEQKNEQKELTERQRVILNVLQENPSIAQQEMSKRTGIKYSTLRREMDFLRQEGYITREGGKTYGYWVVIQQKN